MTKNSLTGYFWIHLNLVPFTTICYRALQPDARRFSRNATLSAVSSSKDIALMKRLLLLLIPVFLAGCAGNDGASQARNAADSTEAHRHRATARDLIGRWALVDQRGYDTNHPLDVNQVLTFDSIGRMTNIQSTGGQTLAMVLTYQVEGNLIVASVQSAEMNGEPLDLGDATRERTYRWRITSGRLILQGSEPGTEDVYHRDF